MSQKRTINKSTNKSINNSQLNPSKKGGGVEGPGDIGEDPLITTYFNSI